MRSETTRFRDTKHAESWLLKNWGLKDMVVSDVGYGIHRFTWRGRPVAALKGGKLTLNTNGIAFAIENAEKEALG